MTPRHKLRIATMTAALAGLSLAISAMPGATAAPPAASLMRAEFTWTDDHVGSHGWQFACNWADGECDPGGPIPDGTNDDATFPWKTTGAWNCNLIPASIGDLTIEGNVDFSVTDDPNLPFTLTVTMLKIEPTSGDVEITMGDGGEIEVE